MLNLLAKYVLLYFFKLRTSEFHSLGLMKLNQYHEHTYIDMESKKNSVLEKLFHDRMNFHPT